MQYPLYSLILDWRRGVPIKDFHPKVFHRNKHVCYLSQSKGSYRQPRNSCRCCTFYQAPLTYDTYDFSFFAVMVWVEGWTCPWTAVVTCTPFLVTTSTNVSQTTSRRSGRERRRRWRQRHRRLPPPPRTLSRLTTKWRPAFHLLRHLQVC